MHKGTAASPGAPTALTIVSTFTVLLSLFLASGGSCGTSPVNDPSDPNYVGAPGSNPGGNTGGVVVGDKPPLTADDHILGDVNAPITIIEYSEFQCPFCGRFSRDEFPTLKANYIDTGLVRFVYRHFPLRNIHDRAEPAARASECAADQGAFFEYVDLTFATIDGNDATILTDSQLQQHAVTLGLNTTQFNACFPPADSKAARVQRDFDSGVALGLTGTPTFFIENERYTGFQTAEQLGVVIDRLLQN